MAQDLSIAEKYLRTLADHASFDVMNSDHLHFASDGNIRVSYAPFDHIARSARLVLVGITPGLTQAELALNSARQSGLKGLSIETALRSAKLTASFGGAMRSNLTAMLDAIGVNELFNIRSTTELFSENGEQVHFTSALRYPVFVNGKNYNGTPDMLRTPILRQMIETFLAEEARELPDALWLPLGPKAELALEHLSSRGALDRMRILTGLPHPSGANAERVAVFLGRKKPEDASTMTKPEPLIAAFGRLRAQINELKGM